MALEQGCALIQGHGDLVANGHHAPGEGLVVLEHEPRGDHEVVNVVEDEGVLLGVQRLALDECGWVLAPVAEGVEVVGCVVAVVEAVAVALVVFVSQDGILKGIGGWLFTGTSMSVMLER